MLMMMMMMMMMEIDVLPFKILASSSSFVLVEMVMEAEAMETADDDVVPLLAPPLFI
jgi:hypothetical protein